MDREKYPSYFLGVVGLYMLVLTVGFAYFIAPALSFGLGYADFYLLLGLMLAPIPLLAAYEKTDGSGKLRLLITALVLLGFVLVLYMMFLLI